MYWIGFLSKSDVFDKIGDFWVRC